MPTSIQAQAVIEFLNRFEALAEKEDFSLIRDLIAENAYFRFNDGDFIGRPAIQAVFEKTWRGDPTVKKARFYLTDIVVLATASELPPQPTPTTGKGRREDDRSPSREGGLGFLSLSQGSSVSSTST